MTSACQRGLMREPPREQVLTIMEKRGTRHTRRAASAAAQSNAKAGPSPELESAAEAASAAAAERAT